MRDLGRVARGAVSPWSRRAPTPSGRRPPRAAACGRSFTKASSGSRSCAHFFKTRRSLLDERSWASRRRDVQRRAARAVDRRDRRLAREQRARCTGDQRRTLSLSLSLSPEGDFAREKSSLVSHSARRTRPWRAPRRGRRSPPRGAAASRPSLLPTYRESIQVKSRSCILTQSGALRLSTPSRGELTRSLEDSVPNLEERLRKLLERPQGVPLDRERERERERGCVQKRRARRAPVALDAARLPSCAHCSRTAPSPSRSAAQEASPASRPTGCVRVAFLF